MKRILILSTIAVLVAVPAVAQVIDKPAATVDLIRPEFISVNQLKEQIAQFDQLRRAGVSGLPEDPAEVLDTMIQELLLKQGMENSNVVVTETQVDERIKQVRTLAEQQQGGRLTDQQFEQLIMAQSGMSFVQYRTNIREQLEIQRYIQSEKAGVLASVDPITEKEIEEQYRINATNFINPEMVKLREIFIDTRNLSSTERSKARDRAEVVRQKLENGENTFTELVEQYSDDTKARYNEGDKGYFVRNDPRTQLYGQQYFDAIFDLDVNEVSGVVESTIGFHIVMVTDHRDPKLLKLDDPIWPWEQTTVREYIRSRLSQQQTSVAFQQATEELVTELRDEADIRIFEENIENL